jgi:3-hydroxyisobutyrate dehydrogenase-like beta-hydroxyacid dehydrogenase
MLLAPRANTQFEPAPNTLHEFQHGEAALLKSTCTSSPSVVGILSPGVMGTALAEVLLAGGCDVITTLNGRSPRTAELCERSGIAIRTCITDVIDDADVVISAVTPRAALPLAKQVGKSAANRGRPLTYIDVNSVSPRTVEQIAEEFRGLSVRFVDAAIHGIAGRLKTQGTIFASGPTADVVDRFFGSEVRVQILGKDLGRASLMKMMLGGMSKGIIGLFLQSSLLAQNAKMTDEFCAALGHYYPDVLSFVERSLPTYPQHAGRRAQEMREFADTLELTGLPPQIAIELSKLFSALDNSELASVCQNEPKPLKLKQLVDVISATRFSARSNQSDTYLV